MSHQVATLLFYAGIAGLFLLTRKPSVKTSPAIWLAVAWTAVGATRGIAQWLGTGAAMDSPDATLEGSPLDLAILTAIEIAGMVVLVTRGKRLGEFLRANGPILLFLLFGLISVFWSDYPFVAFKRWTKGAGNVMMVLIVLTDPHPFEAVKRFLAWSGFLLIPLSVLLIKYYPDLGRYYDRWEWGVHYQGVAIGKNGLGNVCLIFGLGSLWSFVDAFRERPRKVGLFVAHGTVLAMVLWLLYLANSSTSTACFILGGVVMLALGTNRRPGAVHAVVGLVVVAAVLIYMFDADAYVFQALGRDATLTGRTDLWKDALSVSANPLVGAGYESFWSGARMQYFWNKYSFHPNQAHNGYIEMYLNLGWIGVSLLLLQVGWGYRNIVDAYRADRRSGTLRLALFVASTVYNLSEAAFKVMHPVWIAFYVAVTALPGTSQRKEGRKPWVRTRASAAPKAATVRPVAAARVGAGPLLTSSRAPSGAVHRLRE